MGHQIIAIGDQERISRCCGKLTYNTNEPKRDCVILIGAGALQPQVQLISSVQLKIRDGFVGYKNTVRLIGQGFKCCRCIAVREVRISQLGCAPDGSRIDPIDILQIVPDIGEPVLHGASRDDRW